MTGAVPIYQRIVDDIRGRIASGELVPGAVLPSKQALCRTWGVSRQPVDTALVILRSQGLVFGHVGKGTFVTEDVARIQEEFGEPVSASCHPGTTKRPRPR